MIKSNLYPFVFIFIIINGSCYSPLAYPRSDHFDGTGFYNPGNKGDYSFKDMVRWWWEMETVPWPEWIEDPPQEGPIDFVNDDKIKVTYVNHATMLIQMHGVNILTDPIWSECAGPFSWLGSKRIRKPGIALDLLPEIHAILISHDHYDHLDVPTLKKLYSRNSSKIVTGLGIKQILISNGIDNVQELDWWQNFNLENNKIKITFVPALHNSGRGLFGKNETLWGGFIITGKSGTIYFAGDSGYGDFISEIKKKYPDISISILPLGNYEKRWFMKDQHMNPDDAVRIHKELGSKQSIGMHFATFLEHPEQTIDAHEIDLKKALKKYNIPESEFLILKFGEGK